MASQEPRGRGLPGRCGESEFIKSLAEPSSPGAFLPLSALRGAAREVGLEPPHVADRARFLEELMASALSEGAVDKLLLAVEELYREKEESLLSRLESLSGAARARLKEWLRDARLMRERVRELRGCLSGALSL